jgi:AGZA family xanthine/uracil permease-like MFS transporter
MATRRFVRGDIDGFFGLFVDNLVQLLLIDQLCRHVCGFPNELIVGRILPGAGVSILVGNVFYAWQARRLMERTKRDTATALPYGINTPSLFAFVLFIMAPVYREAIAGDPTNELVQHDAAMLAWRVGLFACVMSGVMECLGAFVGDWLRRHTPRAALLSALAGIAITFIAMEFVFQIFESPAVAVIPMMIVLVAYGSRQRLPFGLPGGLIAVVAGIALAWLLYGLQRVAPGMNWIDWQPGQTPVELKFHAPVPVPGDALALLADPAGWKYMAVILPMGLFNVIGSLQNLESAAAAGDKYETRPSLLANGAGTLVAALLGSTFPTTIYIGHPGWKAMGARTGYSVLNGVAITGLCLFGGIAMVQNIAPIEAMLGILLWIGLIITAQAFEATPNRQVLAVAVGLVPALGAWAYLIIDLTLLKTGTRLFDVFGQFSQNPADLFIHGVIALNHGFIVSSMLLAATMAHVIEKKYLSAAGWMFAAALLSMLGVIHAYDLTAQGGLQNKFGLWAAPQFAAAYLVVAIGLVGFEVLASGREVASREDQKQ